MDSCTEKAYGRKLWRKFIRKGEGEKLKEQSLVKNLKAKWSYEMLEDNVELKLKGEITRTKARGEIIYRFLQKIIRILFLRKSNNHYCSKYTKI